MPTTLSPLINLAQSEAGLNLKQHCIATLLFEIYQEKFTGNLSIQTDKIVRKLAFLNGAPISVSSNLKGETLGPLLQGLGKITEADSTKLQTMSGYTQQPTTHLLSTLNRFAAADIENLANLTHATRLKLLLAIKDGQAKASAAAVTGTAVPAFLRCYLDGITKSYDEARIKQSAPSLQPKSFIIFNTDFFYTYSKDPLTPEERGIATIASSSATIEEVFSQSLLTPLEKLQNVFKLWLLRIINTETPEARQEKAFAEQLTPQQRELKKEIEDLLNSLNNGKSYYELLGIKTDASNHEIDNRYQQLNQRFVLAEMQSLYPPALQDRPNSLLKIIRQAHQVLMDPPQRREYEEFIKSGRSGRFEEQSKSIAIERAIKEAMPLFSARKFLEAYNILKPTLTTHQREPRLLAWAAVAVYHTGQQAKGKELLQFAIKSDPHCLDAYLNLAEILTAEGAHEEVKKCLEQALQIDPKNAKAKQLLGSGGIDDSAAIEIQAIFNNLNTLDYYALLDLSRGAKRDEIQKAYHTKTKQFHPDRFFTSKNAVLRDQARALYKRCVEAYMVLKNQVKRKEYDEQLLQASKDATPVRLKDAGDVVQKKERVDSQPKSPQAKKFFGLAQTALQSGNYSSAIMNLQLALKIEPNNEMLQNRLKEAQQKSKE